MRSGISEWKFWNNADTSRQKPAGFSAYSSTMIIVWPMIGWNRRRYETGPFRSSQSLGGTSIGLHVYVEDVDALFAQAVDAGAKVVKPVQDQFYGDRSGTLENPFGHVWFLATHKEDLTPEEIKKRAEALFKQGSA